MANSWDERKRARTLVERGLDFADAEVVFAGLHFTRRDDRREYGEDRFITAGFLRARFVVITWTTRGRGRRIISMRYGHDKEKTRFRRQMV
ncbi:MAG: BrnT family toxin [Alphaproteobacteria bacterium]|nr:BrnT family toxin [Alphaproteobacteria bacterium]